MKTKNKKRQSYLPEFVYGSMDGLVTTFAIVTGAVGAGLPSGVILIVGFANVLADAFSMGASSYLSSVSEETQHGHVHKKRPLNVSVITFISFVVIGLVPLIPFLIAFAVPALSTYAVHVSVVATMLAFGGVGFVSGRVLKKNPLFTAARNMIIGGIAAGIAFGVGHVLSSIFGV